MGMIILLVLSVLFIVVTTVKLKLHPFLALLLAAFGLMTFGSGSIRGFAITLAVGILTSMGESYAPILEQVALLETVADDIVNMLSGEGALAASYPGREKALVVAGGVTSFWYGIAIGLFIAGIIAFQLIRMG